MWRIATDLNRPAWLLFFLGRTLGDVTAHDTARQCGWPRRRYAGLAAPPLSAPDHLGSQATGAGLAGHGV